eukprot:5547197-Amphidinium_carterae.1
MSMLLGLSGHSRRNKTCLTSPLLQVGPRSLKFGRGFVHWHQHVLVPCTYDSAATCLQGRRVLAAVQRAQEIRKCSSPDLATWQNLQCQLGLLPPDVRAPAAESGCRTSSGPPFVYLWSVSATYARDKEVSRWLQGDGDVTDTVMLDGEPWQ